ncbi:hypothetical protein H4Q26_010611 [Puccinia striiformis f. sp. tritici PST-130]|nr:hypothetical protein H4Q26_010611 [Puccinia striiformis f. sp. tritici PST-130]
MAFDESPSSPLDPHNPLASQQSRDAYLTARRRDTLEVPSGVEHLQLPHVSGNTLGINLSDIPLSVAMRREPNTTPIGRWLQAVEPMSPTHDPALRPVSHWSSDSEPTLLGLHLLDLAASRARRPQLRVQPPRSQLARGHQPDNPGYRADDVSRLLAQATLMRSRPALPRNRQR